MKEGEEEAEKNSKNYEEEKKTSDKEYEKAIDSAEQAKQLTPEEKDEIKSIYRKLVKLYHPDRYQSDQEKKKNYEKLLAVINEAREKGNIEILRKIVLNPEAFMTEQGWDKIDFEIEETIEELQKRYEALEIEIVKMLETLNSLRESNDYFIFKFCQENEDGFQSILQKQAEALDSEINEYSIEADNLKNEITELVGNKVKSSLF